MAGVTLVGLGGVPGVSSAGDDVSLGVSWDFIVRELERLTGGAAGIAADFSAAVANIATLAALSRTILFLMPEMRVRMSNSSSSSSSS